ncbi:hypothetical protein OE09_2079 [Flavobacteriaceae bacterium MAR_2010_72]|nr:hypothetical protein OE09_2079 [Flavobacteriaceae bacterium MAR_2010_72]TVZ59198.1 hypothetical protein NA63_1723 [Flavobacteriaceae bacterium MAR_2010_105]
MKLKVLCLLFLVCVFEHASAQEQELPVFGVSGSMYLMPLVETNAVVFNAVDVPAQQPFKAITFTDNPFNLGLLASEFKAMTVGLNLRLEDELPYENRTYVYSGFYYLDMSVSYSLGAFDLSFLVENFLGLNTRDVSITPEVLQQHGVYNEVVFVYDSPFLISAGISFNF